MSALMLLRRPQHPPAKHHCNQLPIQLFNVATIITLLPLLDLSSSSSTAAYFTSKDP